MKEIYHSLPKISSKGFLWFLLLLLIVLGIGFGVKKVGQPISATTYISKTAGVASADTSNVKQNNNLISVSPTVTEFSNPRKNISPTVNNVSIKKVTAPPVVSIVHESDPIVSVVPITPIANITETAAVVAPITVVQNPNASNNTSVFGMFQIYGGGGGGGSSGGGGGGGSGGGGNPPPDTTAPAAPIVTSPSLPYSASTTALTISGTAEVGATISQSFSATTTTVAANGTWGIAFVLPEGTTSISFYVKDAALNTSNATTISLFIDSLPPVAPTITSPVLGATLGTTSVAFVGTAENNSLISQNFSSATTSTDGSGAWTIPLVLPEGTTSITFNSTDSLGNTSLGTTTSVTISLLHAPVAPTIAVLECGANSLSADVCLSATTTLNVSWGAVAHADYYEILNGAFSVATTSDTGYTVLATDKATSSITVVAHNAVGSATSTNQSIEVFTSPIVVSEVAWMGMFGTAGGLSPSPALVADEWIELFNRTTHTIRLTGTNLVASGFTIPLTGNVSSRSFYLLERTDDNTVGDIPADQIYGDDTATYDLSDLGDKLVLTFTSQNTIMDATPDVATCGGWCAGSVADAGTMERKDVTLSGVLSTNWMTNLGDPTTINGKDAEGGDIYGTPRHQNSTGTGSAVPE